ncbi:hypothetical protein O6H91_01G055600 [Diphasiastrum complanatum]|uniref:Uncharacterized protein n=2 Tax=Diphasiastrum complanatum TaxID=34168 RepID=A0ACC2ER37_DIPCM|nr:hypothetical protein O6H91_01G055600 [Diphasiastrum complanatum]KAJ7568979.1 hypothetical protein O6H91_01G055600 [Diphasiastrum complanatum]
MAADDEKCSHSWQTRLECQALESCNGFANPKITQSSDIEALRVADAYSEVAHALKELNVEDSNPDVRPAFPDEVLEHVLVFITAAKDRNSVSLVCKAWYITEQWSRRHVFIGNCYAVSPVFLIMRFPKVKSITLKGKPRFADFGLVPSDWGAHLFPWVFSMAEGYPWLEELHLKRMVVSDESLVLLAHSFPNFRVLSMINCEGLSTHGLAAVTSQCKNLVKLHLQDSEVEDRGGHWLSCFPESCTALECLNFSCVDSEIDFDALERLVARCPSLKSLVLNRRISLEQLQLLLMKAPQLTDLGTGAYNQDLRRAQMVKLKAALVNCKGLQKLSGIWGIEPEYIPMLYPVCRNLTSLNLSYAPIRSFEFVKLMRHCHKLQRLSLQDLVEDKGLRAVGSSCKDLEELHVFPADPRGQVYSTEKGLIAIANGCPKLTNILYFCRQMTNGAITKMSTACPELTRFRLCIVTPLTPDHVTGQPFDEGFGAIVKNCKKLHRLAVSGKLTDKAFEYIGRYGKKVETLSVAFAGDSDLGLKYVLDGCNRLRKLEIRDCPFGDTALLSGLHQYESMRFLWMSSCKITLIGCQELALRKPGLNVEVIKEDENGGDLSVEKLYVYRSLTGPRADMPRFVLTL